MNTSALHPGDRIEANVKGIPFLATFKGKAHHGFYFTDEPDPQWITYRLLTAREILRKVDPRERAEAAR